MGISIGKRAAGVVGIAAAIVLVGATPALAATGTVHTDSGAPLTVRSAPSTGASSAGTVADGAAVDIDCQTTGETVTGKYGTSNIWDHVPGGYITDTYVYTGSDGRIAPDCTDVPTPPASTCTTAGTGRPEHLRPGGHQGEVAHPHQQRPGLRRLVRPHQRAELRLQRERLDHGVRALDADPQRLQAREHTTSRPAAWRSSPTAARATR